MLTETIMTGAAAAPRALGLVVRLEAQWENWNQSVPPAVTVRVEQGVPRAVNLLLLLIGLAVIPVLFAFRHLSFERRRWADSAFNPYESDG